MNQNRHKDIVLGNQSSQPLSSEDQSKLLIFFLLMLPTLLFLVGLIPAIFLGFGLFLMKKNQDFTSIDVAVKNFRRYTALAVIVGVIVFTYNLIQYKTDDSYWSYGYRDGIWAGFWISVIAYAYSLAVKFLFYKPLKNHSDWVSSNGIFSSKNKDKFVYQ